MMTRRSFIATLMSAAPLLAASPKLLAALSLPSADEPIAENEWIVEAIPLDEESRDQWAYYGHGYILPGQTRQINIPRVAFVNELFVAGNGQLDKDAVFEFALSGRKVFGRWVMNGQAAFGWRSASFARPIGADLLSVTLCRSKSPQLVTACVYLEGEPSIFPSS